MTDLATVSLLVPRANPARSVPAEVLDGITEILISSPDPLERGAAICRMVSEMYDSVSWLRGSDVANNELASLHQIVAAAEAHLARVTTDRLRCSPVPHHTWRSPTTSEPDSAG